MRTDRALEHLREGDIGYEIVSFGPTDSLEEAARRLNLPADRVVKTMVVRRGSDDFVFVLVPGERVIDWPKLRRHLGKPRLSLASPGEVVTATGYKPGSITPLGAAGAWPVVADTQLAGKPRVSIGTGVPGRSALLTGRDLIRHLGADMADVTKPASQRH